MSKTKVTTVVEPCESREEFENTIDQIAKHDTEARRLAAALEKRHQDLDDKYGTEIKELRDEIERLQNNALPYFLKHQEELCKKGQREGETTLAVFGIRVGMPKFVKKIRTAFAALADEWFENTALRPYVKVVRDIDRAAVVDLWKRDRERYDLIIPKKEVSVTQEENFWVEAKSKDQVPET